MTRIEQSMNQSARNDLLANSALVGSLYVGLRYDVPLLTYAAVAVVWLLFVVYGASLFLGNKEPRRRSLPAAIDWVIDLVALAMLAWYGWFLSAAAYVASVVFLEFRYRSIQAYGSRLIVFVLLVITSRTIPLVFVVVACAILWGVWGHIPAAIALGLFATWHLVSLYNGPRMAARNAVYAALTCRGLDFGQLGAIDAGVTNICQRLGVNPALLGPAFPMSRTLTTDLEHKVYNQPANVFSLRALAMHERGISPVGTKVPRWYVVRNPFWAATTPRSLQRYRKKVLREHGVDLVELDPESYVGAS